MIKILIADDEFVERDGIIFLINKFSFELDIKECSDGEEALNYIKENTVDILFTDVKMPFLDGLQLSKKAREIYPNLKIVIFSGFGEFEYAKRAIDIGVSDYILKPINPKEFKETMEKVINDVNEEKKENKNNELRQFREKEYILLKIINGSSIDDLKEKFFMDKHIDFMDKYKNMILMEFDDEFFNDNQKYMEEIRNNIDIKIDYLNLNPQQSIIFTFETIEEEE
ncbi:response regulator [Clostridium neonatale]